MRAGQLLERGLAGTQVSAWHGVGPIEYESRHPAGTTFPVDTVDYKGLFYWLGTEKASDPWVNPAPGTVTLSYSTQYSATPGPIEAIVDRADLDWYSNNAANDWVKVELPTSVQFMVTTLAIRQRANSTSHLTNQVQVHGSNDDISWTFVGENLAMTATMGAWNLVTCTAQEAYRFYRVTQLGLNNSGAHYFMVTELELFGIVSPPQVNVGAWDGWVPYLEDPLTSLDGLTAGAVGTWSVDTRVKAALGGTGSLQMRALSTTVTPMSTVGYLMECEFEVPVNFSSADDHMSIGWLTGDTTGMWVASLRGDDTVVFLREGVAFSTTAAYTVPAAGNWVKVRVLWEASTGEWKLWVDGALLRTETVSPVQAFVVNQMRPALLWHNDTASTSARFRNLKAWAQTQGGYTSFPPSPSNLVELFSQDWSSDGYNGVITQIGEQLAVDMGQTPGTYYNPVDGLSTATPNSPQTTPPVDSVLVSTSQSTNLDAYRLSFRAFDHVLTENGNQATGGEAHTNSGAGEWWAVDFGESRAMALTHFGVYGRASLLHHPRNFTIQGSVDGSLWVDLLVVTGEGPGDGTWWSGAVTNAGAFRHIRLLQTGNNSDGQLYLSIGDIEMWGTLYGDPA